MTELRQSRETRQQEEGITGALWVKTKEIVKRIWLLLSFLGKSLLVSFETRDSSQEGVRVSSERDLFIIGALL